MDSAFIKYGIIPRPGASLRTNYDVNETFTQGGGTTSTGGLFGLGTGYGPQKTITSGDKHMINILP